MPLPYVRKVIIGNSTLYLGDCEKIIPIIGTVDCVIMDPPYEFRAEGGGEFRKTRSYMDNIKNSGLAEGFDVGLIQNGRATSYVIFCHNDQLGKILHQVTYQFDRNAVCTWRKINPMPVRNKHYLPDTEFYIHCWNAGGHPVGEMQDMRRGVEGPVGRSEFGHPTQKPDYVMNKIMKNVNGELIMDPFMGTGSTGVAALKMNKNFIGIETEETWFEVACERCAEVQGLSLEDINEVV